MMHSSRYFNAYRLPLCLLAAALAGCAAPVKSTGKSSSLDTRASVVVIQITKKTQKAADCPVSLKIANRTGTAWDGVSYHLAVHNRQGVAIGKLMGSPRKSVKADDVLIDNGQILGAKCEDIAGAAPVYFGYYPAGKKQVTVHNTNVRIQFR